MIGKIGTNQLQEAIINLLNDPVRNGSIIGFIKNNPISSLLSEGNSLLVQGTSDREWIYISSNDKEEVQRLLLKLESDDCCFASLEDWMIPEVTRDKDIFSQMRWKFIIIK